MATFPADLMKNEIHFQSTAARVAINFFVCDCGLLSTACCLCKFAPRPQKFFWLEMQGKVT